MEYEFTPPRPRFGLIGHRGVTSLAPENTLASFMLAKKLGLSWVEFDIQLTKDKRWIIFHDDTLSRTSNGSGPIYSQLLSDLKRLDAGAWFDAGFKGEKIPTLAETIDCLCQLNLYPNIEIKQVANSPYSPELLAEHTLAALATWPSHKPRPLLSSFDHRILHEIRRQAPAFPLGFLFEKLTEEEPDALSPMNNISIHFDAAQTTDLALIQKAIALKPVIPYTVNTLAPLQSLKKLGCFAFFTDCPQKFIPALC